MSRARTIFYVAAAFNWLAAIGFSSPRSPTWRMIGMTPPEQTLFLHFFVVFVALFGCVYFWIALEPANKRGVILIGAIGKISAFAIVLGHYLGGSVPVGLVLTISGDLVFAALFFSVLVAQ